MLESVTGEAGLSPAQREEMSRLGRVTLYLRVAFSMLMLLFAGFGPGLLLRFPFTGTNLMMGPMSQYYAFRPVIFALLFVALGCVLAALTRRSVVLFRLQVASAADGPARQAYAGFLRPPAFPFVLSGSTFVDILVFIIVLAAYSFWVVVLVETTPVVLAGYQTAGIVLGSYGLFANLIVMVFIWLAARRLIRAAISAGTAGTGTDSVPH